MNGLRAVREAISYIRRIVFLIVWGKLSLLMPKARRTWKRRIRQPKVEVPKNSCSIGTFASMMFLKKSKKEVTFPALHWKMNF